jgi:hypothetical protein
VGGLESKLVVGGLENKLVVGDPENKLAVGDPENKLVPAGRCTLAAAVQADQEELRSPEGPDLVAEVLPFPYAALAELLEVHRVDRPCLEDPAAHHPVHQDHRDSAQNS